MAKLADYSGKFDPNAKYANFSSEALGRLMDGWARIFLLLDGLWWGHVTERFSARDAFEIDKANWVRLARPETNWIRKALNIKGDNIETLFKIMQMDPGFPQGPLVAQWELKNPNHGVITVLKCSGKDWYEQNIPEWVEPLCQDLDATAFAEYSKCINPDIQVIPLVVPHHDREDEFACKFEFKLQKKDTK